ncbi:hypothetical protein [Bradyrhizobium sp. CCBAU 53415]|uniref:hypothetical protein n=1 Tax=Bradyrhizobium sp. CCBAU 53415 TaxID=1325119 RepID=UPI0023055B90|nr:hypothetical protein [Bradyrhizobium sp. CCBAU 53415]MDA9465333.1 hypothetical protein [Bradyrhizobium sp. CCBAU 53415]
MSRKPRRKGATRAEFAAHVGLTVQRVGQMIAGGLVPLHEDGSIDQDAARLAYIDGLRSGVGRSDSAQRVNDIRAEALKFRLERERGEWLRKKEVTEEFNFVFQEMVAALRGLPAAATRDLETRKSIESYLGFACDRFRARMSEVANGGLPEDDSEEDDGE